VLHAAVVVPSDPQPHRRGGRAGLTVPGIDTFMGKESDAHSAEGDRCDR
jgi:hypothetical protein